MISRRTAHGRNWVLLLLSASLVIAGLGQIYLQTAPIDARSQGKTGSSGNPAHDNGQTCTKCHRGGDIPDVELEGPASLAPGETGEFTFTISEGQEMAGGFNVSATGGILVVPPTGSQEMKISNDELTHRRPKDADGRGEVIFEFEWMAPPNAGDFTLYAAGNSINLDGRTSGDGGAATTFVINVSGGDPPTATATITPTMTITPTEPPPMDTPTPEVTPTPAPTEPSRFEIVFTGLQSPHGISTYGGDSPRALIAEGGTGDAVPGQFAPGNADGRVQDINMQDPSDRTTLVDEMTNALDPGGGIVGANHAIQIADGDATAILVAQAGGPGHARPDDAAKILKIVGDETTILADTLAFERENNPNGETGDEGIDSNPWRLVPGPDDMIYIVDAGGNDIVKMDPESGAMSTYAVFPALDGSVDGQQAIPTGMVFGDGASYVSLLGRFPPPDGTPGSGQIRKLVDMNGDGDALDEGENTVLTDGLWLPTDLAMSPDGHMYTIVIGGPPSVTHIDMDSGTATPLVIGVPAMTAMYFEPSGSLLVSNTSWPQAPPAPNIVPDRIIRIPAEDLVPPAPRGCDSCLYMPIGFRNGSFESM